MSKVDNNRICVVESAIKHELANKEEIKLYGQLSYTLELLHDNANDFNIVTNELNKGINFGISTPYPHGLPENVATLFFNVDLNYDVQINETSRCVYNVERFFDVWIKKI